MSDKDLTDNSSFGEDGAKALRERTPTEVADAIVDKVREEMEKNK
jgi:hypothetical protein